VRSHKKNVLLNPIYFKIEFGDGGFCKKKWIWRVLKSMPQKFEATLLVNLWGADYFDPKSVPNDDYIILVF